MWTYTKTRLDTFGPNFIYFRTERMHLTHGATLGKNEYFFVYQVLIAAKAFPSVRKSIPASKLLANHLVLRPHKIGKEKPEHTTTLHSRYKTRAYTWICLISEALPFSCTSSHAHTVHGLGWKHYMTLWHKDNIASSYMERW